MEKLGFAAEKHTERAFTQSILSLVGSSLDTDEIISEGALLQVCLYYRCPQPSPLIWSLLTELLRGHVTVLSQRISSYYTPSLRLLLQPLSLRIRVASPHYLDDGSCSHHPYSALFSISMLPYGCASPRGESQLHTAIHGTLPLPSMGHSHCLFFPVPGMPQTRLWKELESPVFCIFISWPQSLLCPVISGALIQGKITFFFFCDTKTLALCLQIHNTDVPLEGPKMIF